MERIKTNFSTFSVAAFIVKAQTIVSQMIGNPNFMTPNPALTVVEDMINNLSGAQMQVEAGNYTKKPLRDSYRAVLEDTLAILASYVENVCNGDPIKLASSGFDLWKTPENSGTPAAPEGLQVALNGVSGEAALRWKSVAKAKCYIIESTTQNPSSPESVWHIEGVSTRARFTCMGLTPALFYSFRVTAVGSGAGNSSAPSEPATTIVG